MSGTKMASAAPARKVWVGALAGAVVTILVWIIETAAGLDVPAGVSAAMVTVVTALVSYFVPPASDDGVVSS